MTVGHGSSPAAEIEEYLGLPRATSKKKVSFNPKTLPKPMSVRSTNSTQSQVAVFLSVKELVFIANDLSTYKQLITIYNPYTFNVRYKAFCTSSEKYDMSHGSGIVPAEKCTDIVVRLKDSSHVGTVDKFRFKIFEQSNLANCLGEREITVTFLAESPLKDEKAPRDMFRPQKSSNLRRHAGVNEEDCRDDDPKHNYFVIFVGIVCLFGLWLPTYGEYSDSLFAQYLTLSVNQKLVAAFVLGMVVMVVFRSK